MRLQQAVDKWTKVVSHDGKVIVFTAREKVTGSGVFAIGYTILQTSSENPNQDAAWKDYAFLSFSREIRTVGRSVITVNFKDAEIPVANEPFDVVSDGMYVYIFRQSTNDTLYVDRFVYDEATNRMVNAWEVRFRRSRKQDIPLDRKDTFGSTDMNGKRFIEATIELDFVTNLRGGRFSVLILPTELVGVDRWQIFAEDSTDGRLNSFSILRSSNGLFDLTDVLDADAQVLPNRRFQLQDPQGAALTLQSGPDAVLYNQQEWQEDTYGQITLQKRETRVMLAVAAGPNSQMAIVDLAVGKDGYTTQGPEDIPIQSLPPIGTSLDFNASEGTEVAIPNLSAGADITFEAWVYPRSYSSETDYIVQSGTDSGAVFSLALVGGIPTFETEGGVAEGAEPISVHGWTHLAGVCQGGAPTLYVNSQPYEATTSATKRTAQDPPATGYVLGGAEGLTGRLDEVRLWNVARTAEQLAATMCVPIAASDPAWNNLFGYWKMDEPSDDTRFTTVANSSKLGAAANGTLSGPQWTATSAPVGASLTPVAWDTNGLTVATGNLSICTTSASPRLFEGADSAIHLYYTDLAGQWACAAHYSVIVARATYVVPWSAPDPGKPENDESGIVTWIARQAGTPMNNPAVDPPYVKIEPLLGKPGYSTVTIQSYTGYKEVWPEVPLALPSFVEIINGEAAQTSTDPAELARDILMYDYTKVVVTPAGGQEGPAPGPGEGSLIFRALPDMLPSNGRTGMVSTTDVDPLSRGRAGTDGWWQASPPLLTLDMSEGGQFIRILSATKAPTYTGPLVLDRDLAMEGWIRPSPNTSSANSTLFVFNKPNASQYMLGLTPTGQLFAGSGDILAQADSVIPSDGSWTHVAASYRTDFGVQLGGAKYLDAGNDRSLDTSEALTAESWVRLDKLGTRSTVASKWDPNNGQSWELAVDETGHLVFTVSQATATGTVTRSEISTGTLSVGAWHHVAGVYDVAFERQVAIMFDAGSYVSIPAPNNMPTEGITVAMWVKTTGPVKNGKQVLFTSVDPDSALPVVLQLNNGIPEFHVWVNGVEYKRIANRALRSEDWTHLAGSYNSRDGIIFAIDGVAVTATAAPEEGGVSAREAWPERSTLLAVADAAAFTVGGHASGASSFTGSINEVSLWNRGLNLDAIRQKIQHPLAATEVGISGYWRFNDLFGTTAMDLVGTANGTLKGGNFIRVDKGAFCHKVFVDGEMQGFTRVTDPMVVSETHLELGSGFFQNYLQGAIGESRLWKVGRMNWQIEYFADRDLEPNAEGLISLWAFETGEGRIAFDSKSDNNAVIRDGLIELTDEAVDALWIRTSFKAAWTFYIDGILAVAVPKAPDQAGYGDPQASIAALRVQEAVGRIYAGEINELRVWNSQLTGDQVRTSMNSSLSGNEAGLVGYWPISEGSGNIIGDETGQGANGTWIGPDDPAWKLSTAPVGWEIPQIRSVPLGNELVQNIKCLSAPGVASYGQTFDRPRGGFVSSYLQAYAIVGTNNIIDLYSGFKVGDLDLQYIGQAQLNPTVIGYIEGPPPVPAENLKVYPNNPGGYAATATLTLDEVNNETFSYTASRSVGTDVSVSTRIGFTIGTETSAGLGVQTRVQSSSFALGLAMRVDESRTDEDNATLSQDRSVSARKYVEVYGQWVPNTYQIDNGVGDMLFPNNYGFAQVRSGTADMYAMRLKGSGGIVGYTVRPNPDIPEDVNVIMFKLKSVYVKNGTLDGWIGFQPDNDYKFLQPGEHGSYFKPLEAYALKQQIAREQQQQKTWFDNFDAAGLGKREDAGRPGAIDVAERDRSLLSVLMGLSSKGGLSFDEWKARMTRRNMVNTYVWTAEGGLYAEEQQFLSVREESTGGSYSMSAAAGVYTELSFNIGPSFGLDAMFGSTIMTQVMKGHRETLQTNMDVMLTGERYIGTMVLDGEGSYMYTDKPSPGKVKAYRFMSFYLAPSKRNFDDLKDIIDEDWLNSTGVYAGQYNPDALALRSALNNPNEVWRVLHRVTYVSRVPPTLNNEGESIARDARRPDQISIIDNAALIADLPMDPMAPNPMVQVSEEADKLIAELETNPVWGSLLAAQQTEVKNDVMIYMRNFYGIPSTR